MLAPLAHRVGEPSRDDFTHGAQLPARVHPDVRFLLLAFAAVLVRQEAQFEVIDDGRVSGRSAESRGDRLKVPGVVVRFALRTVREVVEPRGISSFVAVVVKSFGMVVIGLSAHPREID